MPVLSKANTLKQSDVLELLGALPPTRLGLAVSSPHTIDLKEWWKARAPFASGVQSVCAGEWVGGGAGGGAGRNRYPLTILSIIRAVNTYSPWWVDEGPLARERERARTAG